MIDRYINRWYKWKEGKVITKRDRIVTNVQMAIRDKEEEDNNPPSTVAITETVIAACCRSDIGKTVIIHQENSPFLK